MTLGEIVGYIVVFVGGSGFSTIVSIVRERRAGVEKERRAEVDRIAGQLTAAEKRRDEAIAAERDSATRERKALEYLSATRRIALDHGVPMDELPAVVL